MPEGQGRTGRDRESGQLAPAPGPRSLQRWQLDTGCPEQGCCLDSSSLGLASPQFHPQEAAQARLTEASAWAEARAVRAWTGKLLEVLYRKNRISLDLAQERKKGCSLGALNTSLARGGVSF